MASKLGEEEKIVTLGQAKDRIVQLTQILARKEYQVLFINKEKEFYKKAFKETHDQNQQIKKEIQQFQNHLTYQLSDNHVLSTLQTELASQIKTVKEVSTQMIDALTFYKDLNSLVTEQEFEDNDILCAQLNEFLGEWSHKM